MHASSYSDILALENEYLRIDLMPGQGAKICSLTDLRTGREWLLPSQLPGGGYLQATCGAEFSAFDTSGFDECFPTVSEGPHPDAVFRWPDHGELWSRPWTVEPHAHGLLTRIEGQAWPYTFSRRAFLDGDCLCLDYTLENHAEMAFRHLWSAHPLLNVTPGMKLLLPGSLSEAFVNGASDPGIGCFGESCPWPELIPGLDFSTVQPVECGKAIKLFFPHVPEGTCGILDPCTGEALTFAWDRSELPHLGLWLCYGGWPGGDRPGQLTVALEPCSGMPDRLLDAAERGLCSVLEPGERKTWSLRIRSHTFWNPQDRSGESL